MHLTGEPEEPPARIGAPSMVDQTTGLTAALGLLAAVIQARSTGKGCDVDTCLLDVAVHQLGYAATWYLNDGLRLSRQHRSAHYALAPVQTFPTADGWIFIMCMTDKFWFELADAVGRSDLKSDKRFSAMSLRHANRVELSEILDPKFRKQPTRYWLDKLKGRVPIAPVLDVAQALDSPFLAETQMIRNVPHPAKPGLRALANPIRINGKRLEQSVCSPLGADNAAFVGQSSRQRRGAAAKSTSSQER
jgi:crotonobetainyl-CoA:carnitine CoA-transferase CaiB-like acyl-CoA transferase